MKKHKERGGFLAACVSTLAPILSFALLWWLHSVTSYLPFLLSGIFILTLALVAMCLLVFSRDIPLREKVESDTADDTEAAEDPNAFYRILDSIADFFIAIPRCVATVYNRYRVYIMATVMLALFALCQVYYALKMITPVSAATLAYWQPVVIAGVLVLNIILDKWCKHAEAESDFVKALLRNSRTFFYISKIILIMCAVSSVIYLVGYTGFVVYLTYAIDVIFYYVTAFILVSVVVLCIKRSLDTAPALLIPLPFALGDLSEFGVLSFLEENTGITMRSLWSIKLVKKMIPYMVIAVACLLWFATGIVQVESNQEGAVYRFGQLREDTLAPGLHITLPYPIDKVVLYDTETVQRVAIGYNSNESGDNIWTSTHGDYEYRLLLGSGDELVSMNLRVEYKIGDLYEYLVNTALPATVLESQAYKLVTDRTIDTDLATLLSVDRDVFANELKSSLITRLDDLNVGIEVVSVIVESIHPPVEVADVYQKSVSAEIDAERMIVEAEAQAAVKIANAEKLYDTTVNMAYGNRYDSLAEAKSSVSEFMASVEAFDTHRDAYVYHKYLQAIQNVYGGSDFIIVGEGIDSSNIYFGNTGSIWE